MQFEMVRLSNSMGLPVWDDGATFGQSSLCWLGTGRPVLVAADAVRRPVSTNGAGKTLLHHHKVTSPWSWTATRSQVELVPL